MPASSSTFSLSGLRASPTDTCSAVDIPEIESFAPMPLPYLSEIPIDRSRSSSPHHPGLSRLYPGAARIPPHLSDATRPVPARRGRIAGRGRYIGRERARRPLHRPSALRRVRRIRRSGAVDRATRPIQRQSDGRPGIYRLGHRPASDAGIPTRSRLDRYSLGWPMRYNCDCRCSTSPSRRKYSRSFRTFLRSLRWRCS